MKLKDKLKEDFANCNLYDETGKVSVENLLIIADEHAIKFTVWLINLTTYISEEKQKYNHIDFENDSDELIAKKLLEIYKNQ